MATREAEPLNATTSTPIEAPAEGVPDRDRPRFREIGRSIPRLESAAKVNGTVEYIHNLRLPGCCTGGFTAAPYRTGGSSASIQRLRWKSKACTL